MAPHLKYALLSYLFASLVSSAPYASSSQGLEYTEPAYNGHKPSTSLHTLYEVTVGGSSSSSTESTSNNAISTTSHSSPTTYHLSPTGYRVSGRPGLPNAPYGNVTAACPPASATTVYSTVTEISTSIQSARTVTETQTSQVTTTVTETKTSQVTVTSVLSGANGAPGGNGQNGGTATIATGQPGSTLTVTSVVTQTAENAETITQPGSTVTITSVITGAMGANGGNGSAGMGMTQDCRDHQGEHTAC